MTATTLVLGLLVAVVALTTLANRIRIPYPIVLVFGGLLLAAFPSLPKIRLEPDLVLLVFLPPLVYAAAWQSSPRELRANLRPILLLAVGLVLTTTIVVAKLSYLAVAELALPAAFVLGAIVSPTDTVAAEAVIRRLHVPGRIATVLGGESLINDATGLVAYAFAVEAARHGSFAPLDAVLEFVKVSIGGGAIGLIVGVAVTWVLHRVEDAPVAITCTLLAPYAAFLPAQELGLSGVLAVVAAGLYGTWHEPTALSSDQRLQARAVWETATFVVNGVLFILIGLQLRTVIDSLADPATHTIHYSALSLVWYVAITSAVVIVVRVIWVFVATYLPRLLSPGLRRRDPYPDWRNVAVIAWAGMRGGISLAAALALTAGGHFAETQIALVTFLVFGVILGTLIVQGLTLPLLIARLRLGDDGVAEREAEVGRLEAAQAALRRLGELEPTDEVQDMRLHYQERLDHARAHLEGGEPAHLGGGAEDPHERDRGIRREVIAIERRVVIGLRDRGVIGDEALRTLQHELDLEEIRL